jgi:hypothetical protein
MGENIDAVVHCYSGSEYAERPISFEWQGSLLEVEVMEAQLRTPEGKRFRVWVSDGRHFDLSYDKFIQTWSVYEIEPAGSLPVDKKRSKHA